MSSILNNCKQENIRPCFILISGRLGEFQCLKLLYFYYNWYGQIQDEVKLFASVEGWILHGAKVTLYMYRVCWHRNTHSWRSYVTIWPRENKFSCKKKLLEMNLT